MTVAIRLMPLTIAAMLGLLAVKSVVLVQAASPASVAAGSIAGSIVGSVAAAAVPIAVAVPSGVPPISDSERALLVDLRQRRALLDAREARIDQRAAMLAAAEHRLSTRVDELTALQAKLQALETARRARDESNWAGLVKLYEAMKPHDAATIFNELDMAVLLPVVDRMKETKAALVLAAMEPAKARLLTTNLAQTRLRANTVGG